MVAYNFVDENKQQALYWRDVGTLDSYYDANMDLCSVSPIFNLYDKSWPMRTRVRQYPPAKFVFGEPGRTGSAVNSVITAGVIISGASVSNSVLSQDVRVNSYSDVDASIIFSHVNIGRHCRIRKAIIDRDVHIPEGTVIGYDPVEDKRRYFVTPSGLTIVTRDASLFENPVDPEFLQRYRRPPAVFSPSVWRSLLKPMRSSSALASRFRFARTSGEDLCFRSFHLIAIALHSIDLPLVRISFAIC